MASMHLSSYGCMQEIAKHERTVRVTGDDGQVWLASWVLNNFSSASITWQTQSHANHKPILLLLLLLFYNTDIISSNFNPTKPNEGLKTYISMASSECVYKIVENADDVSKLLGWNFVTWLAML